MGSKVYFVRAKASEDAEEIRRKTRLLLKNFDLKKFVKKDDLVAIKLSFGEEGNKGHINPRYVGFVADEVKANRGKPFLTDTNTLYKEKRQNAVDHLGLALEHGFTAQAAGAVMVIADGLRSGEGVEVEVGGKHFRSVRIARACADCDSLIVLSHVTGHMLTGFAAALKNIGMGLATRAGKLLQHSRVKPAVLTAKCSACGLCVARCPAGAIEMKGRSAYIAQDKCIGCGVCLEVCRCGAIKISWDETPSDMQEKMAEHALGVMMNKRPRCIFLNYAMKITRSCDCMAKDEPPLVADIGILASQDPVAVDRASADLVVKEAGFDLFGKEYPKADWRVQLNYAASIGVGDSEYELLELS